VSVPAPKTSPDAEWWPAPGKLNLTLRIVGRRPDGYHLLQTVFQFLDYGDRLRFQITHNPRLCRGSDLAGVTPQDDLSLRAARLLQRHAAVDLGARITLEKRLPMGAGLGGGSSDAATVLVALNRLWNTGLAVDQLADLGLQIGADVPVFVHGYAAWAEGVGETLVPLDLREHWYLVVVPGCRVSTAEVFAARDLTRNSPRITIRDFLAGENGNDCEAVVRNQYPEVARALDWLGQYAPARLTGTGACVFAQFASAREAQSVVARLPEGWGAIVARGLNRSPLRAHAEAG